MRKLITSLCALMLFCTLTYAQTRTVTGKVTDAQGKPVPFATVTVKGSSMAVSADESGNFTIEAGPNSVLVFSAAGYQGSEVNIKNQTSITALVTTQNNMNEVVVTALGIRRTRNSLPYSTQQVSGNDLNKTMNSNFVENLSGKVAGLQITSSNTLGGSTNSILRGMKSLTQSNQALFVIDGIPFDNTNQSRSATGTSPTANRGYDLGNSASDLNPEDIESVSVLKGAAASALYGSRAINGVILITTKKGRKNAGLGVTATFGIKAGTPDASTLPVYQTQYGQGYGSAGYSSLYPNQDGFFYYAPIFNSNGQRVNVVQFDQDAATGPAYNPNINVYNWDAFIPGDPNYGKATPWMPAEHHNPVDYFVTPVSTSTSLFVDGGGEKGTFKLGLSHDVDKGFLPNSNLTKNLINLTATHEITNKINVSGQFNYSDVNAIGRYGYGYVSSGGINPMTDFRQWWPTNVNILAQKADFFNSYKNASWNLLTAAYTTGNALSYTRPAYHDNLYFNRYVNFESDGRSRYFGNVNANYKINSFLNLMGRISMDAYNGMEETRWDVGSNIQSVYYRFNNNYKETNYDLLLNFDKNVTDNINVKALLGSNIRKVTASDILANTNGGLVVPGFFALSNSVNNPTAPAENYQRKEVDGVFTGATISYKELLTIDGTLRRDQSSTLPKGNNTYFYPAISGNLIFSKLLPTANWLSFGKLRANYAEVSGDAPIYSLNNTYLSVSPFNGQTLFSSPVVNNNPNLVPERNKTYELGMEMSFFKNRFGLDVTYYNSKQFNQIMPVNVSTASGFGNFYVNGGTVQNKGLELMVNIVPIKTKNFSWDASINWSKNQNNILTLYNGQPSLTITSYQNSIQLVAEVGKPWGVLRGTDYQYVNGKPLVDASGLYVLNPNHLSDIGNINPDWIGGINNSFRYKNLSFSFLVDIHKGGDVYSLDMDYGSFSGLYPETAGLNDLGKPVRNPLSSGGGIILPGVTADGKPNTTRVDVSDINAGNFPFSSSNSMSDKSYVYDASYVKLREVALSYSLPKSLVERIKVIKGIDLSLTGRNLWIIHKNLPYSDPEQGVNSGNGSMGFQSGAYPAYRMFGFNIKVRM